MASEYKWSKTEILERVYLDELITLIPIIQKRKFEHFKEQLVIVQNPHSKDPQALWRELEAKQRESDDYTEVEFDATGLENLKAAMSQGKAFLVK